MPTLTTLASLASGSDPFAGLVADSAGDLFGTTLNNSTVFELVDTAGSFSSTPVTLATLSNANGTSPYGGLLLDTGGDLFGTAANNGAGGGGSVFEIAKTTGGYASAPTIVVSFSGPNGANPMGGLIADANGDLFGTTYSGSAGALQNGTVFEIAKTAGGYAAPTTLASFDKADGSGPEGNLVMDASGNLFGITAFGGAGTASGSGTLFEIAKTAGGYASTPTTLVSFNSAIGSFPGAGLIMDAAGDLFGTTEDGGASNDGTVFELAKTASGYASAPTTLLAFNGADGSIPTDGLIADAAGDLFGTTQNGGSSNDGVAFELSKTAGGYAVAPVILATFNGTNGSDPSATLYADAAGDLFGTALQGGANNGGTVFEITNSGFTVACYCEGTRILTPCGEVAVEALAIGDLVVTAAGAALPVRWLGQRSYTGRFLLGQRHLLPILLQAGSLGNGLPRRDLRVSPSHAMFIDGLLIPAACLVNGTTIRQHHCAQVEYFHIELAHHDVVFAEGAASETFLDDGSRGVFHNAGEYQILYPEAVDPGRFCAPRIESGFEIDAIRKRLDADVEREVA